MVTVFLDVLQELYSKIFTSEGIKKLEGNVSKFMVFLEQDCSIWSCNITIHLVHHMVEKIADTSYSSWMYTFERISPG